MTAIRHGGEYDHGSVFVASIRDEANKSGGCVKTRRGSTESRGPEGLCPRDVLATPALTKPAA